MPDASSISALDARLAALERQIGTLKRLLLVALAGIIAAFGAGAAGAAQKSLQFADAAGRTRVKIDATGFKMYDGAGHSRIEIGFNAPNKPSIYLRDPGGSYVLGAYISTADQPVIRIADSQNSGRAYFGLTADRHQPRIEFDDAKENERLYVGLTQESSGLVRTFSASGSHLTTLGEDQIAITDGNGNDRAFLGTTTEGDGLLKIYDSSTRERVYAGIFTSGDAGFEAMNGSGEATWTSP